MTKNYMFISMQKWYSQSSFCYNYNSSYGALLCAHGNRSTFAIKRVNTNNSCILKFETHFHFHGNIQDIVEIKKALTEVLRRFCEHTIKDMENERSN